MTKVDLIMAILFILFVLAFLYKLKPFLSSKELKDDDRTPESIQELYSYIATVLQEHFSQQKKEPSIEDIFNAITKLDRFDSEHFWRLNANRIRVMVQDFYAQHDDINTLEDMSSFLVHP